MDPVACTPRSQHLNDAVSNTPQIRFMCSFGGKFLLRPHDNQLRYIGGDTRIVTVHRHTTFSSLLSKVSKPYGTTNISVKYQLHNEYLDSLITVKTDDDVENMMEEYDRRTKPTRFRIFVFHADFTISRTTSVVSLLMRENWFAEAVNGGKSSARAPSILFKVPDYLTGSDDWVDEVKRKYQNQNQNQNQKQNFDFTKYMHMYKLQFNR